MTITKGTAMSINGNAGGQRSLITQATLAAVLAITLVACSKASTTVAQTGTPQVSVTPIASSAAASAPAAASVSAPASSSSPAAASGLSGTWSGHYSGASTGTFTLNWTQSGSALSGTIDLKANGVGLPINGTVDGDSIKFGTVGSTGITYEGTVSGNSMSGTYQVIGNAATLSGPWSASKSS